ncbi:MAG: hypothetical protein ACPGFA_09060 [Pikeienuella sp.]
MIKATSEYGIVLRVKCLSERNVALSEVRAALQFENAYDQSDELISFGPSFGEEALEEFVKRLQDLGLEYWDDFFEFKGDYPDWIRFRVELGTSDT